MRLTLAIVASATLAAAELPAPPAKAEVEALIAQGQAWLQAQQLPSGSYVAGTKYTLGSSELALEALASPPMAVPATDPGIAKGLAFVMSFRQKDGGIYEEGLGNYCTSLALMVFAATGGGDPAVIKGAQDYLFGIQNRTEGSIANGGIGYGSRGAGNEDLSNTSFAITALRSTGVPASDPHLQAALKFLERCQDLSAVNSLPWVKNTGGGVYSPDESKAGGSWDRKPPAEAEKPKLLPYGSMTYALISDYLALDLKPGDPRVDAALAWTKGHYQWEANPGMAKDKEGQGLFYYYLMAAKTYDLVKSGPFEAGGKQVDWRADLFAALKNRAQTVQLAGGATGAWWVNKADRWAEGMPVIVTSYAVRALKRIHASL